MNYWLCYNKNIKHFSPSLQVLWIFSIGRYDVSVTVPWFNTHRIWFSLIQLCYHSVHFDTIRFTTSDIWFTPMWFTLIQQWLNVLSAYQWYFVDYFCAFFEYKIWFESLWKRVLQHAEQLWITSLNRYRMKKRMRKWRNRENKGFRGMGVVVESFQLSGPVRIWCLTNKMLIIGFNYFFWGRFSLSRLFQV